MLISKRLPLLRFRAPEYETTDDSGCVTWRIDRGLLVASAGRGEGFLRIRVARGAGSEDAGTETVRVRLEVRNFYPWLRGGGRFARFGAWLYGQTQLRIHVLVCNAFLRSLARLDLPPSRVGALAGEIEARPTTTPPGLPSAAKGRWRRCQILVTGATGFIGALLSRELLDVGHEVRCLVRDPGADAAEALAAAGCELAVADLTRPAGLAEALEASMPPTSWST